MKKRLPRKERKSRLGLYITLVLAALMILSVFGIVQNQDAGQTYNYEGHKFVYNNRDYQYDTKIDGVTVKFSNIPQDLLNLEVPSGAIEKLKAVEVISVSYDPQSVYAEMLGGMQKDLSEELYDHKKTIVQIGLLNATEYSLPEISCDDATPENPVLIFEIVNETANKTGFIEKNNCFVVKGISQVEMIQYFDRIRYGLYDIIA